MLLVFLVWEREEFLFKPKRRKKPEFGRRGLGSEAFDQWERPNCNGEWGRDGVGSEHFPGLVVAQARDWPWSFRGRVEKPNCILFSSQAVIAVND